jgi:hypothetical protein
MKARRAIDALPRDLMEEVEPEEVGFPIYAKPDKMIDYSRL